MKKTMVVSAMMIVLGLAFVRSTPVSAQKTPAKTASVRLTDDPPPCGTPWLPPCQPPDGTDAR